MKPEAYLKTFSRYHEWCIIQTLGPVVHIKHDNLRTKKKKSKIKIFYIKKNIDNVYMRK